MSAGPAARVIMAAITWYRQTVSPTRPPACRYVPTCSAYAMGAVERFGAVRGCYLTARRILRCHPFHKSGYDPVPVVFSLRFQGLRQLDADGSEDPATTAQGPADEAGQAREGSEPC